MCFLFQFFKKTQIYPMKVIYSAPCIFLYPCLKDFQNMNLMLFFIFANYQYCLGFYLLLNWSIEYWKTLSFVLICSFCFNIKKIQYNSIPISQEHKIYFLFWSLPPQAIKMKITAVILNGVTSRILVLSLSLTNWRKQPNFFYGFPYVSCFFSLTPES